MHLASRTAQISPSPHKKCSQEAVREVSGLELDPEYLGIRSTHVGHMTEDERQELVGRKRRPPSAIAAVRLEMVYSSSSGAELVSSTGSGADSSCASAPFST